MFRWIFLANPPLITVGYRDRAGEHTLPLTNQVGGGDTMSCGLVK